MSPYGYGAPPPRPPPRSSSGAGVAVAIVASVVIGVVLLLIVVGFAVGLAASSKKSRTTTTRSTTTSTSDGVLGGSTSSPSSTTGAGASAGPAKAEVRGVREGKTTSSPFWIATYANTGKVAIQTPSVRASLFDAQGRRVGEQRGFSALQELPPGEATPVLVLAFGAPAFQRAELAPVDPQPISFPSHQVRLTVTEKNVVPQTGTTLTNVVGTVENRTGGAVKFVQIVASGRDAQGVSVSYGSGFATAHDLPAGGSTGYSISMGTFQVTKPATYDVIAVATGS